MPIESTNHIHAAESLVQHLVTLGPAVIAYSGGVDSAVVAAAAHRADGLRSNSLRANGLGSNGLGVDSCIEKRENCVSIAVTAHSPSLSQEQLEVAKAVAKEIGIKHLIVPTHELERAEYQVNDRRRCFYCKETLYATLWPFAQTHGYRVVLSGTNADDLQDYRPGIEAGNLAGVTTPLAGLGLSKDQVRAIARSWNLSIHDRPAQPCLSSRLAYGVQVTPSRLHQVEQAEQFLRERNYSPLRVRLLPDQEARIEVSLQQLATLSEPEERSRVTLQLLRLGFRSVTIDPAGFRSGSLNHLIQIGVAATTPATDHP